MADAPPLDLAHLDRQTLGDADLRRDVLALFVRQTEALCETLAGAGPARRAELAHRLIGAARGIGAFALADCAAAIEADPADDSGLQRLSALLRDVRAAIAQMR